MRTPSEYIAAAVKNVQSRFMPDCALLMTHGDDTATVTRTGSITRGEPDLSGDDPAEQVRVLALASDFPKITKGSVALLGDDFHVVTSVRTDAAAASMYVGMSQALARCAAYVTGVRGSRSIRFPVGLLAVNNGLAPDVTDGFAPTTVQAWTLCVACDDWPEVDAPHIGDEFRFEKDGDDVRVKVSRCNRRERHYVINARSR